jgi:hypothetical protein
MNHNDLITSAKEKFFIGTIGSGSVSGHSRSQPKGDLK